MHALVSGSMSEISSVPSGVIAVAAEEVGKNVFSREGALIQYSYSRALLQLVLSQSC